MKILFKCTRIVLSCLTVISIMSWNPWISIGLLLVTELVWGVTGYWEGLEDGQK